MVSPVSTWMGDRLGTLDAVGISILPFLAYSLMFWTNFLLKRIVAKIQGARRQRVVDLPSALLNSTVVNVVQSTLDIA